MKVLYDKKFLDDIHKIRDTKIKAKAIHILNLAHTSASIQDIPHVAKMNGHPNAFRIRLGSYRIGFFREKDTLVFVRFLHRREIYKFFP